MDYGLFQLGLNSTDNGTPLRTLLNAAKHAAGTGRSFGAVVVGYLGMRTSRPDLSRDYSTPLEVRERVALRKLAFEILFKFRYVIDGCLVRCLLIKSISVFHLVANANSLQATHVCSRSSQCQQMQRDCMRHSRPSSLLSSRMLHLQSRSLRIAHIR